MCPNNLPASGMAKQVVHIHVTLSPSGIICMEQLRIKPVTLKSSALQSSVQHGKPLGYQATVVQEHIYFCKSA